MLPRNGFIGIIGLLHGLAQNCRNLARNAQYALAVVSVCGYAYIENIVVKPQNRLNVRAVFAVLRQNKQSAVIAALVHIPVNAQLRARTKHTLGFYSA